MVVLALMALLYHKMMVILVSLIHRKREGEGDIFILFICLDDAPVNHSRRKVHSLKDEVRTSNL